MKGPELEICGYGCEDHFLEQDTFLHSWQSMETILNSDLTDGILCDIGMPVLHHDIRYNCRVFVLNRKIVFIRPKMDLADDGNYRESRWFTVWSRVEELDDFCLPLNISAITNQKYVPFGVGVLDLNDTVLACETCEELFTPQSTHILSGLNGAEIITNGSGSHHNLRKLDRRLDLIKSATSKSGGVYLCIFLFYLFIFMSDANQQGCDGGRLYYDGCALVAINGDLVAQGSQFSVHDVEVVTAVVNLDDVRSFRASTPSRNKQASASKLLPRIKVDFSLCGVYRNFSKIVQPRIHCVEEEIAFGPACWLWDFLRRSGASGYFLPLSGGADSSCTATLVGIMTHLVVKGCATGDKQVISDARRVAGESSDSLYIPNDPREFCNRIFHTCYMGTSNSSEDTRRRAHALSEHIGSYHMDVNIDSVVSSMVSVFSVLTKLTPKFKVHGGTNAENLALQNIQARLRMVLSYFLAQLLPWTRSRNGYLLVLGSSTVDEALRGYLTKYDCSSADINPIGAICKNDLYRFLKWASENLGYTILKEIVSAPATAELEPITATHKQASEVDMGLSYDEMGIFGILILIIRLSYCLGKLRKLANSGPVSMFSKLKNIWSEMNPLLIAEKVKRFFTFYSVNRHKSTTLTPSYHAENYSPDDNRYDHRQFLYNVKWPRQFRDIDSLAAKANETYQNSSDTAISRDAVAYTNQSLELNVPKQSAL